MDKYMIEETSRMPEEDFVIDPKTVEEMIQAYGKRTLRMGTLNKDGSLSVPMDCFKEAAAPLLNGAPLLVHRAGPQMSDLGVVIDKVGEARLRKVAVLTKAVQDSPTEDEAKKHWQRLAHLMFGC